MPWEHERLFYRIRYPLAERPRLWSASCAHEAVDCCEGGIRYEPGSEPRPPIGAKVRGRIRFREGVEVEGVVVRVAKTVAVSLTTHRIPSR